MLENQEGTTPEPTIDELKAKVAYLEGSVQITSLSRDSHMNKLAKVREFVQNSIDNEEWTDEELDEIFWTELAELLDLEMMKEVRIDISVSWTATAKVKRGQDVEDLDMSVDEPESGYGFELYNVRETSFDISEA